MPPFKDIAWLFVMAGTGVGLIICNNQIYSSKCLKLTQDNNILNLTRIVESVGIAVIVFGCTVLFTRLTAEKKSDPNSAWGKVYSALAALGGIAILILGSMILSVAPKNCKDIKKAAGGLIGIGGGLTILGIFLYTLVESNT